MAKRILVLHSGGMDSTTCLYKAKAEGADVFSLGIDYGQKLSVELLFAAKQCATLNIPREVISVTWRKPERPIPIGRDLSEMRSSISPAFLPARNVVLLSLACAYAAGISADEVHTGLNCIDFSGYPDCTIEFFGSYRSMMAIANPGGARIEAPLLDLSKPEIASLAKKLGIGEDDTWSCYQPQLLDGAVTPCRVCDACRLHEYAWAKIR
jgi:7-cyano-7-deazaguanine synthase